jgi:hypothetical protein
MAEIKNFLCLNCREKQPFSLFQQRQSPCSLSTKYIISRLSFTPSGLSENFDDLSF